MIARKRLFLVAGNQIVGPDGSAKRTASVILGIPADRHVPFWFRHSAKGFEPLPQSRQGPGLLIPQFRGQTLDRPPDLRLIGWSARTASPFETPAPLRTIPISRCGWSSFRGRPAVAAPPRSRQPPREAVNDPFAGNLSPYLAGTVTIGTPSFPPVSEREKTNIRKENICLDCRSLLSIQNQWLE